MSEGQRILIVDDSPSGIKVLNDALQSEYQISATTSGEDALRLAKEQRPDLILLDIKMPGMDGYEVCRRLKADEETRSITVLFVTILNEVEDETRGLELGAVDYIVKPISPAIVRARVRNHMRLKMHQDRLEELVKERTLELAEAKLRAEKANAAKNEFLANLSHEVRTPMSSILGMTEMVLSGELNEEQRECLEMANEAGRTLLRLLTDLLDIARIESGKLSIDSYPFNVAKEITAILGLSQAQALKKGLEFEFQIDPNLPELINGDPGRTRQVLANLISNAIKFTDMGGVKVSIGNAAPPQDRSEPAQQKVLTFSVCDTGIGIEADKMSAIFQSFTQVDNSITRHYGGLGLGLPIARELVKAMGGELWAESQPGKGSCFHFTLPLASESLKAPPPKIGAEPSSKAPSDRNILLVEDNEANRRLFQLMLEKQGFHVQLAENGRHALDVVAKETPDLILMDIQMPEMDGFEATRRIRTMLADSPKATIPIIALTAYARKGERQTFLDAGMNDVLPKPIRAQELSERLLRHLAEAV